MEEELLFEITHSNKMVEQNQKTENQKKRETNVILRIQLYPSEILMLVTQTKGLGWSRSHNGTQKLRVPLWGI